MQPPWGHRRDSEEGPELSCSPDLRTREGHRTGGEDRSKGHPPVQGGQGGRHPGRRWESLLEPRKGARLRWGGASPALGTPGLCSLLSLHWDPLLAAAGAMLTAVDYSARHAGEQCVSWVVFSFSAQLIPGSWGGGLLLE